MKIDLTVTDPKELEVTDEDVSFSEYDDGKYTATGMSWFTLDDNQLPLLVGQSDGKLVGRCRFHVDDEDGPPMSLELNEMPLLVKAFNESSVEKLPAIPAVSDAGAVMNYMRAVEEACKGEILLKVKNGWVNEVKGMEVPKGPWEFYLNDISPKDENGNPYPLTGEYGQFFFVQFVIVSGPGGQITPYAGCSFDHLVNYAVKVTDDEVDFEQKKNGGYTAKGKRFKKLIVLTVSEPGEYDVTNPQNILPEWAALALTDKRPVLQGTRVPPDTSKSTRLNRTKLIESSIDDADRMIEVGTTYKLDSPVTGPPTSEDDKQTIQGRETVIKLLSLVAGEDVRESGYMLNKAGVNVAREYISPLKDQGKVKHGTIGTLSFEDCEAIINSVAELYEGDKTEEVKEIRSQFLEDALFKYAPEDNDTPF